MSTAIEGRTIRLEILARQLMEQNRAIMNDLLALRRDLRAAQLGGYNQGGGGGVKPQAWVVVPAGGVPGAAAAGEGSSNPDRIPVEFSAVVWEASSGGTTKVDGGSSQSLRWWGRSRLFEGETLPLIRAADGAFEAIRRHTIAIGKVAEGTFGDPYTLNQMAEIVDAYSSVETLALGPPPHYVATTQVSIPSVWAVGPRGQEAVAGEYVMVHLLTDICYFHKL